MEPTTTEQQSTEKKGRPGSLDNPEAFENVPGHVIPILTKEYEDFDNEAEKFLAGHTPEDQFIGFRLKQGVYGQRQADVQMIRVKLPFGGVTPEQMEAFAEVAERYAPLRKGHITTRQNIQLHHIPLRDAAQAIRLMGEVKLSSREACGNTVRNVTGDPYAGICEGEAFDPTPYVAAFVRYFVRNELTQLLPRKFKVAFTSTDEDRAITNIHDLGFLPRVREIDGKQVRGFEIRTGGGTSIMPRIGSAIYDFVTVDDGEYLKVSEAVLRIFDRADELRKNRARARIKFLVDRVGMDEFRRMVDKELKGDWVAERDFDPAPLMLVDDEAEKAPPVPASFSSPNGDRSEFQRWVELNGRPQRQEGFTALEVKVTRGDLTPEQFRGLAAIMREFTGGYARMTVQQNIVLRWVRNESLYDLWQRLRELDLGDAGSNTVTDVVSCPGTDSCKLGITSSMGLNRAVQERLEQMQIEDPLARAIHIKMSGCPNGCSQHHLSTIGFYGASIKAGGHTLPAYVAHIGGSYENGDVRFGQRLKLRLPAKRVPDAVERWIDFYLANRNEGEEFNAFADRVGAEAFEDAARDLGLAIEFSADNLDFFIDWNRDEPFQVIRGEGECAI